MAPLEPWEKVLINPKYTDTTHGKLECIACHAGVLSHEKETAHTGLIPRPSEDRAESCAGCHTQMVATYSKSLHSNLDGYLTVLQTRSEPENHPALEEMFGNHCAGCHTTCGDCHVSQPHHVGGGFLGGHIFQQTPPMTRTCTACHGSRVGNEYLGRHDDLPGDIHFRNARMNCISCHPGENLHQSPRWAGMEEEGHRYNRPQNPSCESCHPAVASVEDPNLMHHMHVDDFSCQVCHSITYTSCDGCHVAISSKTGNPYYETEATYFTFFIGRNTRQDENRPFSFVPVRHVPADPDAYSFYGENLLPNFDSLPTWAYATPHNIQLKTPQNESCQACHGKASLFLTEDKVAPDKLEANRDVIVYEIPAPIDELLNPPLLPDDHLGRPICQCCHTSGSDIIPQNPSSHAGWPDLICQNCHVNPGE